MFSLKKNSYLLFIHNLKTVLEPLFLVYLLPLYQFIFYYFMPIRIYPFLLDSIKIKIFHLSNVRQKQKQITKFRLKIINLYFIVFKTHLENPQT